MRGARRRLMVMLAVIAVPATAQAAPSPWSTASTEEPQPQVKLSIVLAGSGEGTVYDTPDGIDCGSVCSASVTAGWRVYLEAVPYRGHLHRLVGRRLLGDQRLRLEVQADTTVTATFEPEPTPAKPECRSNPSVESIPPRPSPPPKKPTRRVQRLKCGRGTKRQELPNGAAECVRIERKWHRR